MTPRELDSARRRMGWTRSEMARQAGYTPRHFRRMFAKEGRQPIPEALATWARGLAKLVRGMKAPKPVRR